MCALKKLSMKFCTEFHKNTKYRDIGQILLQYPPRFWRTRELVLRQFDSRCLAPACTTRAFGSAQSTGHFLSNSSSGTMDLAAASRQPELISSCLSSVPYSMHSISHFSSCELFPAQGFIRH